MKKVILTGVLAATVLAWTAGSVWADEDKAPAGEGNKAGMRMREGKGLRGPMGEGRGEFLQSLNLTPEKQAEVKTIMEAQRQAVETWRKENAPKLEELGKKAQEAMKTGKTDEAKAAREEIKKIMESRKALHEDLLKKLGGVLTPEQMEKVKAHFAEKAKEMGPRGPMGNPLGGLNPTEEQKTKAKAIMDAAREAAEKAATPEEKHKIMRDALEKIRTEVLTEEQRKALEERRAKMGKEGEGRKFGERMKEMRGKRGETRPAAPKED